MLENALLKGLQKSVWWIFFVYCISVQSAWDSNFKVLPGKTALLSYAEAGPFITKISLKIFFE